MVIAVGGAVITRLIVRPVGPMRLTAFVVTAIVGAAVGIAISTLVVGTWGVVVDLIVGLVIVSNSCYSRPPGSRSPPPRQLYF